jgi:hypothetical protein
MNHLRRLHIARAPRSPRRSASDAHDAPSARRPEAPPALIGKEAPTLRLTAADGVLALAALLLGVALCATQVIGLAVTTRWLLAQAF